MLKYDVAIIGSGPSGASTALKLAENGISTVIIEKEILPRYKTCGGGFVYRGRKDMPFDISSVTAKEFNRIDIYFDATNIHLTSQRDAPIITMVMRDEFDNLIVKKAVSKGVTLLQGHKLEKISFGDTHILHTSQGDIETTFIIAADGALSKTAKLAGWKETRTLIPALEYEVEVHPKDFERLSKEVRFDFDAVPFGYGWSFPKKNHLSIGVASMIRTKIDLKQHYKSYLQKLGVTSVISEEFHGFQIPITPRKDGFVRKNVFLIGDAAGFADPITAEGISNAILSGIYAAESIIEGKLNPKACKDLYNDKISQVLLPELKIGTYLSKVFYKQEKVRNYLIKKYGDVFCEAMTDIFMGERSYPTDIKNKITRKLKNALLYK